MSKKRATTTLWLLFTPLNYSEIYSARLNHDLGKFNQEIFLILLDKIMARSHQDVPRIFLLDLVKITHVLSRPSRCIKFRFTGQTVAMLELKISKISDFTYQWGFFLQILNVLIQYGLVVLTKRIIGIFSPMRAISVHFCMKCTECANMHSIFSVFFYTAAHCYASFLPWTFYCENWAPFSVLTCLFLKRPHPCRNYPPPPPPPRLPTKLI